MLVFVKGFVLDNISRSNYYGILTLKKKKRKKSKTLFPVAFCKNFPNYSDDFFIIILFR